MKVLYNFAGIAEISREESKQMHSELEILAEKEIPHKEKRPEFSEAETIVIRTVYVERIQQIKGLTTFTYLVADRLSGHGIGVERYTSKDLKKEEGIGNKEL